MRHETDLPPLGVPETAPLFPPLHAELLTTLRALGPDDWERPTVAGAWRVHDVAAHLLDGELRKLAAHRDGHRLAPDEPLEDYASVVRWIQRLNAGGVAFGRRLSPALLTDLLAVTGTWMSDFVASLDPDAPALFPVAWAGDTASDNRFDTAREYTERWHHQMQIRAAVGATSRPELRTDVLLDARYLAPLLDTAVKALPHAYRSVTAPAGTSLTLVLSDRPLAWTLRFDGGHWRLFRGAERGAEALVASPADVLWRLLFNALPPERARAQIDASGPDALLEPFWRARSVMV